MYGHCCCHTGRARSMRLGHWQAPPGDCSPHVSEQWRWLCIRQPFRQVRALKVAVPVAMPIKEH